MKVTNVIDWQKWVKGNDDPYGKAIVKYAERWADLMESRMAEGAALENIADDTSHQADTDGITGFIYGAAVHMLAGCWEHGDQLRRWHNLKTQIGTEGEEANRNGATLNPALLTIGKKE